MSSPGSDSSDSSGGEENYKRIPYHNELSPHWEEWNLLITNRYNAACVIQKYWRQAISDPNHKVCRNRLMREYSEII